MSDEKKGHVKITIDIELNEEIVSIMKEGIVKMPEMVPKIPKA
jgi:hypothetical protein